MSSVQQPATELHTPVERDSIREIRTGKMKPMEGLTILSGIDKLVCKDRVKVTSVGIAGDEHDYTFHGGPEKAIHAFCSLHYPTLRKEYPDSADRLQPGGFGENFVVSRLNERNVCIGDVVEVGDEVVLQVSLPRQPCFKLNHRFRVKDFATMTWKTSRTGWYYRVLKEGMVKAGDEIRLVRRPHPKWTIEQIQEYLHRNTDDFAMNEELAAIEEFGDESRGAFQRRVAKAKAKQQKAARAEAEKPKWKDYRVVEKTRQTPRVTSFVLEAVEPDPEAEVLKGGAHARVKLGNGLLRAYSIVSGDRNKFELGIALDEKSRGGSHYFHNEVELGHIVEVASVTGAVPSAPAASHRIFVAGGIGITAFIQLLERADAINYSWVLHYAIRSREDIAFKDRLDKLKDKVIIYDKEQEQRISIHNIVQGRSWNSQLYFCGPRRMMDEAAREVKEQGVPEKEVHFEAFDADVSGDPFEAVIANRDHKTIKIGEDETLLDVLKTYFDDIPSSCEVGNCGTCKITVKEGSVDHRGTALTQEEKSSSMLSCVSRGIGRIVVEI